MKHPNRREILEKMAVIGGGTVSLTLLAACDAGVVVPEKTDNIELKALNQSQLNFVADIADTIIPDTETPGAKAVNVHFLIDELIANWMSAGEREMFLSDLTALIERIKTENAKLFSQMTEAERSAVLDQLGAEMLADNPGVEKHHEHVYKPLREMVIFGYYTSETGASEELMFDPIPGDFKGCIPFDDVGKTWFAS